MAEQQQEETTLRKGREGGRWINERPTPEEVAQWFRDSVRIDDALSHDDYVGGLVLIPTVEERSKYVAGWKNGRPEIAERPELAYTPHPRVQARVNYFWDLVGAHDEYEGVIEPVETPRTDTGWYSTNENRMADDRLIERERIDLRRGGPLDHLAASLPKGFFIMTVPVGQSYTHFLACQYHCAIYEKDRERPVREGWGTQQVPLVKGRNNVFADPDAIAKAETSAKGRALGAAGILVVPGGSIASAEDMLETAVAPPAQEAPAAPQEGAQATEATGEPSQVKTGAQQVADERERLLARARELADDLKENHPGKFEEFGKWANALRPPLQRLSEARGARLRGVVTRLERMRDEAQQAQQQRGEQSTEEGNDAEAAAEPAAEPKPEGT